MGRKAGRNSDGGRDQTGLQEPQQDLVSWSLDPHPSCPWGSQQKSLIHFFSSPPPSQSSTALSSCSYPCLAYWVPHVWHLFALYSYSNQKSQHILKSEWLPSGNWLAQGPLLPQGLSLCFFYVQLFLKTAWLSLDRLPLKPNTQEWNFQYKQHSRPIWPTVNCSPGPISWYQSEIGIVGQIARPHNSYVEVLWPSECGLIWK